MQQHYRRARDRAVPLMAIHTVDPAAAINALKPYTTNEDDHQSPLIQWTITTGFEPVNDAALTVTQSLGGKAIINPTEALMRAQNAPPWTALVFQNLSDHWPDPKVRQAFWNLRDPFKVTSRNAIVMGPNAAVPRILEHDVLVIKDPLPDAGILAQIVRNQYIAARLNMTPSDEDVARAVDAVAGLSAFAAEQAVALSLGAHGLDFDQLRERHRQMIENTPGLSVWRGGETFGQVGGLRAFIEFANRFLDAKRYRPGAVIFIDEIEKALAGIRGDLTGISQDYLSSLLTYMQDGSVPGILLMGHPGTGKSLLAKAFGNTAGVPTIRMDLGAMHGSLVGESQHALRHALDVSTAVSQGRPIVIATCNSVAVLPPELVNRFKWRFFVELPDEEEKAVIWPLHMSRRGLDTTQALPNHEGWNGREIEQACETAYQLNTTVADAAQYVVPINQSSAEEIERRRTEASDRYLSASYPGAFGHVPKTIVNIGNRQVHVKDREETWTAPGSNKPN